MYTMLEGFAQNGENSNGPSPLEQQLAWYRGEIERLQTRTNELSFANTMQRTVIVDEVAQFINSHQRPDGTVHVGELMNYLRDMSNGLLLNPSVVKPPGGVGTGSHNAQLVARSMVGTGPKRVREASPEGTSSERGGQRQLQSNGKPHDGGQLVIPRMVSGSVTPIRNPHKTPSKRGRDDFDDEDVSARRMVH